ncbi:MAG: hypothetical protein ACI9S7_000736 [Candidatus Paceibacteria bacterium]|jgi:hypothetical protein
MRISVENRAKLACLYVGGVWWIILDSSEGARRCRFTHPLNRPKRYQRYNKERRLPERPLSISMVANFVIN